jgi:hypothetical protein
MMQQGFGSIYNMEGLGSSGPVIKGLALYSATKSALTCPPQAIPVIISEKGGTNGKKGLYSGTDHQQAPGG